jgi:HD-GYP domain-containing protein (c-di-GMP phosphodiesterase class II)
VALEVSVISVADSYDAMTADRPYRKGLAWDAVRAELLRQRGKQWRERAVDALIDMIDDERRALPVDRPVAPHGAGLPASRAASG